MKKDHPKEETPVFVKLAYPKDVERTLLTTTMEIGGLVKRFEVYQRLRNIRLEKTGQLERSLDSVRKELLGFTRFLPKLNDKIVNKEETRPSLAFNSLDKELFDIERRLKEL